MSIRELIGSILAGLAILTAFLAVVGALYFGTLANTNKVRDLTESCIEQGYQGWEDDLGCFE